MRSEHPPHRHVLTDADKQDDMLPSTPDPHELAPPTENELRLGRKVLDLEKERDSLAVSFGSPRRKPLIGVSPSSKR